MRAPHRIRVCTPDWSSQGTVEVVAELKAEDGGPFLGNLRLVPFAEVGLPPKSGRHGMLTGRDTDGRTERDNPPACHRHLNDVCKPG
jgi:hypothetical protein